MKKIFFLLLGLIFVVVSCKKDDDNNPNPKPPNPVVYNSTIHITFSSVPANMDDFGVVGLGLSDANGVGILEINHPWEVVTLTGYDWVMDTAFARQYRGKTLEFYMLGCREFNHACTGQEIRKNFTLKVKPDVNEIYVEIEPL